MIEGFILAGKVISLFLGVAYACPVIIGGAFQKDKVTNHQVCLFTAGVVGFTTLQWLI